MKLKHRVLLGLIDLSTIILATAFIMKGVYYFFRDNDARCIEFLLFGLAVNLLSDILQNGIAGYLKGRHGGDAGELYNRDRYGEEGGPPPKKSWKDRVAEVAEKNKMEGYDGWVSVEDRLPTMMIAPYYLHDKYDIRLCDEVTVIFDVVYTPKGFLNKDGKGFADMVCEWRVAKRSGGQVR
jgi:hypothetical protein